jgi:hypothetical protein
LCAGMNKLVANQVHTNMRNAFAIDIEKIQVARN